MDEYRRGLLGRGRARGAIYCPKKPDVENYKIKKEEDVLSDVITQISAAKEDLNPVVQLCVNSLSTAEHLRKLANFIHSKCLEQSEFIPIGTTLCCKLASIENENVNFRNVILSLLQEDFKDREHIRKKSRNIFMNCVHFLCRVFNEMRFPDGSTFEILAIPILTYFRILIGYDSTEEEIKLFGFLMNLCGKELDLRKPEEVDILMQDVRLKIIDGSSSRSEKALLLQVLEINIRSWQPLPENLNEFYYNITT